MNRRLVIFGAGDIAELAHFYFSTHTDREIVAFTVDAAYLKESTFCGRPVVAFEDACNSFDSASHDFFVALGYSKLNGLRKEKYLTIKSLGYGLASYISPKATILNEGRIGENCFILEDSIVQPLVHIGDNVTLWSGCHVGHHSVINDHCFIAPKAAIAGAVEVGEQCFIGVNATLRDHIKIGARCVIGAGALLLADAAADGVYVGAATERGRVPSSRLRGI